MPTFMSYALPNTLTSVFRAVSPFAIVSRLAQARALSRQRAHLMALDARLLADVGLTEADVQSEANAPFWNAPAHWRR